MSEVFKVVKLALAINLSFSFLKHASQTSLLSDLLSAILQHTVTTCVGSFIN